jgi:hypothetical protein
VVISKLGWADWLEYQKQLAKEKEPQLAKERAELVETGKGLAILFGCPIALAALAVVVFGAQSNAAGIAFIGGIFVALSVRLWLARRGRRVASP